MGRTYLESYQTPMMAPFCGNSQLPFKINCFGGQDKEILTERSFLWVTKLCYTISMTPKKGGFGGVFNPQKLNFYNQIFFFHFAFISTSFFNNQNFPYRFFLQLPPVFTDHRSLFQSLTVLKNSVIDV